jgi:hypothetical protein
MAASSRAARKLVSVFADLPVPSEHLADPKRDAASSRSVASGSSPRWRARSTTRAISNRSRPS